jgi:hypothetical protein
MLGIAFLDFGPATWVCLCGVVQGATVSGASALGPGNSKFELRTYMERQQPDFAARI